MKYASSANREKGAALITSLIFLTVLTILGMSTLGTALLESRMAGNMRDRNIAFQAAEMGLRDAELFIRNSGRIVGNVVVEFGDDTQNDPMATTCTYGFCHKGGTWTVEEEDDNWLDTPVWDISDNWDNAIQYYKNGQDADDKVVGYANVEQLAFNPDYDQPTLGLPLVRRQPEYLIESFSPKNKNEILIKYYYRITVRGYGMRPGTRVMLQEVYTPN